MISYVIVAALVGAVVAIAVYRARSRAGGDAGTKSADATPAAAAEDAWLEHLRSLLRLNATLRERVVPAAVTAKIEAIVDELREVLPELNDEYAGSELTWTVNRMASDYLPRVVDPYLELSPGARGEHEAELLASLTGLETELTNIHGLVRKHEEGEFKAKAAFLRARFLESPG
jgi:hypothetical protein